MFLSNTRDFLDDAGQTALMQYIRSGGGFVAIHNPLGAEYHWDYFQGLLGGANFYDHGPRRPGVVVMESKKDVSTKDLPKRWNFADEWYNLEPMPSPLVRILAKVDTDTLNPVGGSTHPGHPGDHPVTWCHYFDGGRSWVTSLGHDSGWQAPPRAGTSSSTCSAASEYGWRVPFCRIAPAGWRGARRLAGPPEDRPGVTPCSGEPEVRDRRRVR